MSTIATDRAAASAACTPAASRSVAGGLTAAPRGERIPIVSHPFGHVNLCNVRALLIINPRATSMTGRDAGLVVRALGSRLELDTTQTHYRGHAGELAAASAADGYDLVVTFSGDGTVNEVVNGLMHGGSGGNGRRKLRRGRPSHRYRAAAPTCSPARSVCRRIRPERCSDS